MTDATEEAAIVAAIRKAFARVRRGRITLHEALVIDSFGYESERLEARLADVDRAWTDVPAAHLDHGANALAHLDPVSWRYYLPAFMVWVLANFRTSQSLAIDCTIYTLDPAEENSQLSEYTEHRFRLLDEDQCAAVSMFLRHMARGEGHGDEGVARRALDEHWERFGGGGAAR